MPRDSIFGSQRFIETIMQNATVMEWKDKTKHDAYLQVLRENTQGIWESNQIGEVRYHSLQLHSTLHGIFKHLSGIRCKHMLDTIP